MSYEGIFILEIWGKIDFIENFGVLVGKWRFEG